MVAADGKAADEVVAARSRRVEAQERGAAQAQSDLRWADQRSEEFDRSAGSPADLAPSPSVASNDGGSPVLPDRQGR
jgi:hypothetical protein